MRTLIWTLCLAATAAADVRLAGIFGDDMVLQQGRKIPVWGRADPGEEIKVSFSDQSATTKADRDGRWRVELGPFMIQGGRLLIVEGATNRIEYTHVCVGEVWVCSGQSNMNWPVARANDAKREIEESYSPRLRLYTVPRRVAGEPMEDVAGSWVICGPETVGSFSAVAYYFGRELRELGIPVGLVHASWGGTPAEAWTSPGALEKDPKLHPIVKRWDDALARFPKAQAKFQEAIAAWQKSGRKGRRPRPPLGPKHPHRAGGLYNGMIAPLVDFPVRGVIWYQGESNAARAAEYRTLFPALIRDWRARWKHDGMYFFFVQLANFKFVQVGPVESQWAELREAQRLTLTEPATAMAVTIDIGEARDIHPKNKQEVGRRLALPALALIHGQKVVYSGPMYASHEVRAQRIILRFTHVGGGLRTRDGKPLNGFAIAGADGKYRWARCRIEGDTVVVWALLMRAPKSVRYAWADNPVCNLINKEGLPASPFQTDGS